MPTDGRSIVAHNENHPLAALSKVGDDLSLRNPESIKMSKSARERAELDVYRLHEHGLWATMEHDQ